MRAIFLIAFSALAFVLTVLASVPLSFALTQAKLHESGISSHHPSGTVWNGAIRKVDVAGQDIGRVEIKTRYLSALTLSPKVDWTFSGPTGSGRGTALVRLNNSARLTDTVVDLNIAALSRLDPRLRQAPSTLSLTVRDIRVGAKSECLQAEGVLSTDVLSSLGGRYAWAGPRLVGDISCDGENFQIALRNEGGDDDINASINITPSGIYDVSARVNTRNENVLQAITVLGFERRDGAYFYTYSNGQTVQPIDGET